jgi:DNA repair exonuclease SbcCD ATPase subunit
MIVFKKIKYKNFLSTGNTPIEIDLNKAPTTLVIGSNGSGKSTLLDALCFVLFNKPFRLIKKEQIVNTINDSDTVVEVNFTVGTKDYKIIRGIKPNIFEIYDETGLINQEASTVDYQKYLETNIMRLNYRSFLQVVLLGSSSYEPFMKMKPRYRREVVEEILDIRVFGLMDLILRSQQSDLQKLVTETKHKCDLIESKYELEQKHFKELQNRNTGDKDYKQQVVDKNNKDLQEYIKKITTVNAKIEEYQNKLIEKNDIVKKSSQLSKLETKIEQNLNIHKKNLEFFQENDTCPTCTQPLQAEFRGEKIAYEKGKITTLNDGMEKLIKEITKTETKVSEMESLSKKIQELNVDLAKINASVEEIKKYSDKIHEEIMLLENKESDGKSIEEDLQKLKDDLTVSKGDLKNVIEKKQYVDILREILNDKGAKARIIKKYLPIMNTLINQYLQSMDFFVNFNLDEEFNETIKSRYRDSFNYNSFSEGEKMRIDLALLFTWRSIAKMKNSTNTNLLILDEIFDSSLDAQGTEDFFKIIKTLPKENIFIISHKGDILFDKFTNVVKFDKEHNFTKLQKI